VWTLAIFAIIRLAVLIGNTAYGLVIGGEIPVPPHTQASFDSVPNFLYSILLAPLIEELAFRQFLYKPLKKVNITLAVLIPAVLFAVSHGNLFQCVYALPAGILMGIARARYGSLVFSLLVHSLNNISTILISECLRSEGLLSKIFNVIEAAIVVAGAICLLGIIVKSLQRKRQKQIDEPQPPKEEPGRIFAFDLSVALWICAVFLIITCGFAISAGYGVETYPKFQIVMAAICAVNVVFTIRNALHKRRLMAVSDTVQSTERTAKIKISPVLWLGIAGVIAYTAYIHFD
jgi:membrane protease YdiL (CAAX protease family)